MLIVKQLLSGTGPDLYLRWLTPGFGNNGGLHARWTWSEYRDAAARFTNRQEVLDTLAALRIEPQSVVIENA